MRTDLNHTIFQLRNAMKNAEPGPYDLYTSNSFRRVGLANKYKEIVYATTQRDGHPDIMGEVHLHAMVMAFNAVPALLAEIGRLRAFVESAARCGEYASGDDLEAAVSMLRDDARKLL